MSNFDFSKVLRGLLQQVFKCGLVAKEAHNLIFSEQQVIATLPTSNSSDAVAVEIRRLLNQRLAEFAEAHKLGFISTESSLGTDREYHLVVNPLDGADAFMVGLHTATIVASVLKIERGYGKPVLAIIHEPIHQHTWYTLASAGRTSYLKGISLFGKYIYTINNAPKPWRASIYASLGSAPQLEEVKRLTHLHPDFKLHEFGGTSISAGLVARGVLSLAALPPGSATEAAAMQLILDGAGGISCDFNGTSLGQYQLGELQDKQDFLLPHGAVFAASPEIGRAFLGLVAKAEA